ncbi:MAG: hypothetical protein DHS20C02_18910 [Micavibrio sp.]|nr:MAG: hypothetical protein DHS20C02_18910 [Micavibrio sp.]
MAARNHHYIPQCYLKGFVKNRDKAQLYAIDCENPEPFTPSTAGVGSRRDFHRIDIEGLAPDALENAFSGFEGELDQALRRINAARSLDDFNDKSFLLNLIGIIHVKNPQIRSVFHDFEENIARRVMDLTTSSREIYESQVRQAKENGYINPDADIDYETAKSFFEEKAFKIEVPTERHLQREMDLLDTALPCLFNRSWHLLKAPKEETGFVTSDHPVVLQWQDPKLRSGPYPPGLGLKNTEVLFSVSNTLAVVGTFEEDEMEIDASSELIAKFNGAIISCSKRQVYARDDGFMYAFDDMVTPRKGDTLIEYVSSALEKAD